MRDFRLFEETVSTAEVKWCPVSTEQCVVSVKLYLVHC